MRQLTSVVRMLKIPFVFDVLKKLIIPVMVSYETQRNPKKIESDIKKIIEGMDKKFK